MEKYIVPIHSLPSPHENPKPLPRRRWKMTVAELNGRVSSKHRHGFSGLLIESYSEVGEFSHCYYIGANNCPSHLTRTINYSSLELQMPLLKEGITGMEFDDKGVYLASVTKSGCLTVHDFETLYCLSNGPSSRSLPESETQYLLHINAHQQLDVVRWNPTNQDEVACTSMQTNKVLLYDIGYISSEPAEVLQTRPAFTVHGSEVYNGLPDVAFTSADKWRLLASDLHGSIYVWDRRLSTYPCLELTTNSRSTLNSIQLSMEDQVSSLYCMPLFSDVVI